MSGGREDLSLFRELILNQGGRNPPPLWSQGSENETSVTDRTRFIGVLETLGSGMRGKVEAHRGKPLGQTPLPLGVERNTETDKPTEMERQVLRQSGRKTPMSTASHSDELTGRGMMRTGPHSTGRGECLPYSPKEGGVQATTWASPFQWTGVCI